MNRSGLLKLAIDCAKSESIKLHKDKVVHLCFTNGYDEYSVVPEDEMKNFLERNPHSLLVAKIINGDLI
jgi:hypothetical protein